MKDLTTYLLIIWLVWIIWVSTAVYHKWTRKNNKVFYALYAALLISFGFLGFTIDFPAKDLPPHPESLASPLFLVLRHFLIAVFLTAFLQAGVWWFTRRWHRK